MNMPPRKNNSDPLIVDITTRLTDIFDINHEDFSMIISVFMSISWIDPRVKVNGNKSYINLDVDFADHIWVKLNS